MVDNSVVTTIMPARLFGLLIAIAESTCLFAHSVPVHERITDAAIQYLRTNLPPADLLRLQSCLPYIETLLLVGTDGEDNDVGNRFMFHFSPELHSPVYELGSTSVPTPIRFFSGDHVDAECSSLDWAFPPRTPYPCHHNQPLIPGSFWMDGSITKNIDTTLVNDHTWAAAVQAGTSTSADERATGWRHLGYVLHLIQDLTSPAHARSDAHPHWPEGALIHFGDADPIEFDLRRVPLQPAATPLPLYSTPEEHFTQLQSWTQTNFYSRHTLTLPGPAATAISSDLYFLNSLGKRIARVGRKSITASASTLSFDLKDAIIDDVVADEQWNDLGPQAVLYTASLIYEFYLQVGKQGPCDNPLSCVELSGMLTQVNFEPLPAFAGLQVNDPFSIQLQVDTTAVMSGLNDSGGPLLNYSIADYSANLAGRGFDATKLGLSPSLQVSIYPALFSAPLQLSSYAEYDFFTLPLLPMGSESDPMAYWTSSFDIVGLFQGPLTALPMIESSPFPPPIGLLSLKSDVVFLNLQTGLGDLVGKVTSLSSCFADVQSSTFASAASYDTSFLSPGEIFTVFGSGLGPSTLMSAIPQNGVFPTSLGGTVLRFDGQSVPLLYVSDKQLSAVAPYSLASKKSVTAVVETNGKASSPFIISVSDTKPAVFTANGSGKGPAAALNADLQLNGASRPARVGSVIVLYATGLGTISPSIPDGAVTGNNLSVPTSPIGVSINGEDAAVLYAGTAPGLVAGLYQINVTIPADTPSGAVEVRIKTGEAISQAGVTIAVSR